MSTLTAVNTKNTETMNQVLDYKHPEMIERLKRKHDLSHEEAKQLFEDTLRYLFLCVFSGKTIAPAPKIDKGWHEFLMYTRDYKDFCEQYLGRFVHHNPTPVLGSFSTRQKVMPPQQTKELAKAFFGSVSSNWDAPKNAECSPEFDCHNDDSCGGDV